MCTSSTTIKTTTFIISLREYSKEELLSVVAFLQNHVGHYILSCYQIYPLSEVGCSISNMDRINEYLIFDKNLWLYSIVWQMYNYSSGHYIDFTLFDINFSSDSYHNTKWYFKWRNIGYNGPSTWISIYRNTEHCIHLFVFQETQSIIIPSKATLRRKKRISLICLYIYCYVFLFCPLVVYEFCFRKNTIIIELFAHCWLNRMSVNCLKIQLGYQNAMKWHTKNKENKLVHMVYLQDQH